MNTQNSILTADRRNQRLIFRLVNLIVLSLTLAFIGQTTARAADGDLDAAFNAAVDNGSVARIVVQTDGKILIGGSFTTVGGAARGGIARLNADGSLDASFNPGAGATGGSANISAVAVQADGKVLVGGSFTTFNGATRDNFARLNADGSLDTAFAATFSGSVSDVAVQADGNILVGGFFTTVNSTARQRIAQLTPNGTLTAFSTPFNFPIAQNNVTRIALQPDGKILINGFFDVFDGTNRRLNIARLNADGTIDPAFVLPTNGTTSSVNQAGDIVYQPDGKVLAATSNDATGYGLRRFLPSGGFDPAFNRPTTNSSSSNFVNAIYLQADGKIIIGGGFTTINGEPRNRIARLNADGTLDATFNAGTDSNVSDVAAQTDGKILIGGPFTTVNGAARLRIARLLNNPGTPTATRRAVLDFDGDGKSDYAVARAADANSPTVWYINNSANQFGSAVQFGTGVRGFGFTPPADIAAPEDFDGDGKTDIAVWRAGELAYFYILQSSNNTFRSEQFGRTGDNPTVIRDYDGDGKADVAVYREGTSANPQSVWYYRPSGTPGVNFRQTAWGAAGDFVAPGDYDGDGKGDFVVYRNVGGSGVFFLNKSAGGSESVYFGLPTDQINPGDYDGDGKTDFALSRYDTVNTSNPVRWFILTRAGGGTGSSPIFFGVSNDFTVQGDYDGDGKTDIAVWRRANGTFYVRRSGDGGFQAQQWGQQGDYPVGYYNAH